MASGFQGRGAEPRTRMLFREREKPLTTPSAFQEEMSLTTKQKLARAKKLPPIVQPLACHDKVSAAEPKQSLLQPCPAEVVFQKYSPGEVCEVPVVLRNMDKVSHLVKVTLESSPYFQLVGPNGAYRKVPPGLSKTVRILFTPGQNKDYFHRLVCVTEREELIVPIRAIGARAVLQFPDQLDFSECAVKYITQKTVLLCNVGNREAHFQLRTQSPFSVIPATGTLGIGDSVQVTVGFLPMWTGDYSASLVMHYDTGEDTHTRLHGRAVDVDIRLDRNTVAAEKTYITLSNRATVLIHNQSEVTACFQWKAVGTQEQENQLKLRQYLRLCRQEKDKLSDFLTECGVDATGQERFALLARSAQSERAKVGEDPMLFCDDVFSLEPKEGEIRPKCWAEISVFFKPQAARVYEQTVYCDVTGRENRLPLQLTGEGLGPRLCFRFEELNIGNVCVRAAPKYEAVLLNKGPLQAPFSLVPPATAMGSCFTFLPQEGILAPNRLQAIRISFCPTILGEFQEQFCFHVTGSPKPVTLTIRGCVVGPTLLFDVPALHFGDVSFGFPHTLECRLSNASLAHMPVNLRIAGDGLGEFSVDSFAQMGRHSNQLWKKGARGSVKPREFAISPCRTTIRALGSQLIKITLCSNTAREYKLELVVDVIGVGLKWLALPLTARCMAPVLRVLNPVVWFDHCCLKFPYEEKVTLVNDSDFRGCYYLLSQEHKEQASAWYSSSVPSGIIEARGSVQIPITLEAQQLGECNATAEVAVFGREGSPLELHLQGIAHGPVVHVHPREINFGTIPVLKDMSKIIHLENHSAIPAPFRVEMARKHSCWRIEPCEGVIHPKCEVLVTATASLDDSKEFKDKVKVVIENGRMTIIPVQAVGIGTTIVTDKNLDSELDLKSHFSCSPCCYQFTVTNRGRRAQRLYWSTESVSIVGQSTRRPPLRGKKSKNASRSRSRSSPVFTVRPLQVDLRPGQSVEMVLEGCSSTAQEVKERLLCYATAGKEIEKKPVMQVTVTCNFVCPAVQMSPTAITFRVEKKPSDVLTLQYQPLSVKNVCSLPFSIVLHLEHPFRICSKDQQPIPADSKPMTLDVGEELNLCIRFNPAYEKDFHSRVTERVLWMRFMEHPHEEQMTIRGEVYFPNLDLESEFVDFGCIINDTEQELHMEMTNCSPIAAKYHWSLLTDLQVNTIRFKPSPPKFKRQSSKKEGEFLRRYSKAESVEEPTKTPKTIQSSAQKPADAEDSLGAEALPSPAAEPQRPVRKRAWHRFSEVERPKPGMQEVFDVRPLWGELQPGESHTVTFTFFGHANIVARVTALCHVQGGPTYRVVVAGEASPLATNWMWKKWTEGLSADDDLLKSDEDKETETSKYSSEDKGGQVQS